jgi:formylglycine-generating enzyme required for sulfatase activity
MHADRQLGGDAAMTSSDQSQVQRVVRGGSWSTYERDLRSSNRDADGAAERRDDTGFRVVLLETPESGPSAFVEQGQDDFGRYADIELATLRLRLRWIAPGSFQMGIEQCDDWSCRNELPKHRVTFDRGFWIAEHETTRALYRQVMGEDPSHFADGDPRCPVESVSWNEAQEFCRRVNQQVRGVRIGLPSEAQREYAGRSGTTTEFCTGTAITPEQANYNRYVGRPVPVKTYPPNAWGLYNAHGNVWEWTADEYHDTFEGAPADGSAWVGGPESVSAGRLQSPAVLAQVQEQSLQDGSVAYSVVLRVDSTPKRYVTLGVVDADQAYRIADTINEGAVRLLD